MLKNDRNVDLLSVNETLSIHWDDIRVKSVLNGIYDIPQMLRRRFWNLFRSTSASAYPFRFTHTYKPQKITSLSSVCVACFTVEPRILCKVHKWQTVNWLTPDTLLGHFHSLNTRLSIASICCLASINASFFSFCQFACWKVKMLSDHNILFAKWTICWNEIYDDNFSSFQTHANW